MNGVTLGSLLFVAFGGAIMLLLPELSPRRFLFAITVQPDFRAGERGRESLRRYRWEVAAATFATAGVLVIAAPWSPGLAFAIAAFGPIVAGMAAYLRERGRIRRAAPPGPDLREAELSTEPDRLPRWFLLALAPFALPLAAFIAVRQYGPDEYGPLLAETGLMLVMLLLAVGMFHGSRRAPQRIVVLKIMASMMYLLAIVFTGAALHRVLRVPPAVWAVPIPLFVIVVLYWALRAASDPKMPGETTPDHCWRLGAFYYNRSDPAVFVQKRIGFGYTFNWANPWAWAMVAGLVAAVAGVILARR